MGKRCLIFGAGDFEGLYGPVREDDFLIAADGGYRYAVEQGLFPHLVLGDFDSLGSVPQHPHVVQVPVEKDDTDMMLAVKLALERGYRHMVLYGGLGGARIDHTLANLQTLLYAARRGAAAYLVGRGAVLTAVSGGTLSFPSGFAGYLSVFAMGPDAEGVTLRGLKYELHNGSLSAGFPLGVSNEFTGRAAEISVAQGDLLVTWSLENPVIF